MLPRQTLLEGSHHPLELEGLVDLAEQALRTWEPVWSPFLDGAIRDEATERLQGLSELQLGSWGGYPNAERQRLLLQRRELGSLELVGLELGSREQGTPELGSRELGSLELGGLELAGNFLFDPAEATDFQQALIAFGLSPGSLGDLWLRGDRGAQGLILASEAPRLDGAALLVRSVAVQVELRPVEALQLPVARQPRRFNSVEASLRLDAVASVGFGVSRSRMAQLIKAGQVRLNWLPVTSPSRELVCGDRIQLQGKGEVRLETATLTKRERWRVELERC